MLTRSRPGWAVRTVDRWGLFAGVTGLLANLLLVVLFTTPVAGPYAWTGPANGVVGDLSTLAMVPVAVGVLAVCAHPPALGAITSLAVVAMVTMVAVSMLLVLGRAPFAAATDSAYLGLTVIFGWVLVASRAGRATVSVLLPAGWLGQNLMYGIDLLTDTPIALYPIWLIAVSYRLPSEDARQ